MSTDPFDGVVPTPEQAYADAPAYEEEMQAILNLIDRFSGAGRSFFTDREFLLRQAGLIDRTALRPAQVEVTSLLAPGNSRR
ncbi:hypothetical protein [Kitasatospora sp. P5_F3]